MKLIIVGATGLVATELIRQSLAMPEITSVVAVARKAVKLDDENAVHKAKFKSLLITDYEEYPDTLKAEFAGAAACIWQVHSSFIRSMLFSTSLTSFTGPSPSRRSDSANLTSQK
jgi:dTDP-4-dehydrorhamnose reductase